MVDKKGWGTMGDKKFYTITEVAELLGITRQAVHKRIKKGMIKATRIGRIYAIPAEIFKNISKKPSPDKDRLLVEAVRKTVKEYHKTLELLAKEDEDNNNT